MFKGDDATSIVNMKPMVILLGEPNEPGACAKTCTVHQQERAST